MKSWDCFAQWQKNHSAKRTWLIKCKSAKFVTIWWIQLTLHLCWENESILDISYHSVFCAFRTQASGECVSITIGLKKQGILHKKSIRFLGNKNKKKLLNSPLDDQTKHQSSICLYRWRKNSYSLPSNYCKMRLFESIFKHFVLAVISISIWQVTNDKWYQSFFDGFWRYSVYLKNDDWLTFTLTFNLQEQYYRSPNVSDTISQL